MATTIEWTQGDDGSKGETWNPTVGCSRVSPGCENCYAERMAHRLGYILEGYEDLTVGGGGCRCKSPGQLDQDGRWSCCGADCSTGRLRWSGTVRLFPERLEIPLRWRKPRRVFVDSMSDLFHPAVPDEFIDRVFAAMALCPQHTFQLLTKRPERMREYLTTPFSPGKFVTITDDRRTIDTPAARVRAQSAMVEMLHTVPVRALNDAAKWQDDHYPDGDGFMRRWPLPNVWLGTSVENQPAADDRVPHLLQTPAAVRFLSLEPLLGPVDLTCIEWPRENGSDYFDALSRTRHYLDEGGLVKGAAIDWLVIGGESGPGARPCNVEWIRDLVRQGREADCKVFVKQLGAKPRGWCVARLADPEGDYEDGFCDAYESGEGGSCGDRCFMLRDRKGGDPSEWPEDLRIREFPS